MDKTHGTGAEYMDVARSTKAKNEIDERIVGNGSECIVQRCRLTMQMMRKKNVSDAGSRKQRNGFE
jgi:hypothetical protein